MKISELIILLKKCKKDYGDITVGYDSGVMTFTGDFEIEYRREDCGGVTLSLDEKYN